jgi:membrane protein implicated in regulation of membrane protease activity
MVFWHWIALGFELMVVELLVPSYFFLWLGIAALAVGAVTFIFPEMWLTHQWVLFSVMGIAAFFVSRVLWNKKNKSLDQSVPLMNKRTEQMIGMVVTLESTIENGHGMAKIGDTSWSVEGTDAPAGSHVKIVAANGTSLKIEKV